MWLFFVACLKSIIVWTAIAVRYTVLMWVCVCVRIPEVNMSQLQQTTDGITGGQSVETQIYIWQRRLKFQQSAHKAEEQSVEETSVMLAETTMRFCLPGRYRSQQVLAEVNSCNTLIDCSIKHLIRNGSSLLLTTHRQERESSNETEESSKKQKVKLWLLFCC